MFKRNYQIYHQPLSCQLRCNSDSSYESLSQRFQRILDLISVSGYINDYRHLSTKTCNSSDDIFAAADIGGDHGILTSYIAHHFQNTQILSATDTNKNKIIYTDQSSKAAANAKLYFEKLKIENKILIKVGNGLEPLLESSSHIKCHSIIMAGMGCNTIQDIISHQSQSVSFPNNNRNSDSNTYNTITEENNVIKVSTSPFTSPSDSQSQSQHSLQLTLLKLDVHDIILQPYPPHLVPILQLIQQLHEYGWLLQQQYIDQFDSRKWIYMTMKFSRQLNTTTTTATSTTTTTTATSTTATKSTVNNSNNNIYNDGDIVSIFKNMPLTLSYTSTNNTSTEKINNIVWKLYLQKELKTINKIINNPARQHQNYDTSILNDYQDSNNNNVFREINKNSNKNNNSSVKINKISYIQYRELQRAIYDHLESLSVK